MALQPAACSDSGSGNGDEGSGPGAGGESGGTMEDVDGDGFAQADDCDDRNRSVHPDAAEVSLDGVDSNCDGEELPVPELVWSASLQGEENAVDALALLDEDADGAVSLAEFTALCARSSQLTRSGRPGVVQVHASCAGTNSCRGMTYQTWNEVYEHTCRGVNSCAGWSCVETAEDQGRTGAETFVAGTCDFCHAVHHEEGDEPDLTKFKVPVLSGKDPQEHVVDFWAKRSDAYLRSIIAFGIRGVTSSEVAFANMPGSHHLVSLNEMNELIAHLRTLEPVGEAVDPLAIPDPIE